MSIAAAAATAPKSCTSGADPSSTSNASSGTSAFEANLLQWLENAAGPGQTAQPASSTTTASTTSPTEAPNAAGVQHHHHHHGAGESQQSSGGSSGSPLAGLLSEIADATQTTGSGSNATGSGTGSSGSGSGGSIQAAIASITGGGSATGSTAPGSSALAADLAQAMQAYGNGQATSGNILASI